MSTSFVDGPSHLPKPLARENAQPSECYVCTIEGFKNTELSSLNSSSSRLFSLLKRTIYKKKLVHTRTQFLPIRSKNGHISDIFLCPIFLIVKILFLFSFLNHFQGSRKLLKTFWMFELSLNFIRQWTFQDVYKLLSLFMTWFW